MKKIVILSCLRANENCTGMGCIRAFNQRRAKFSGYGDDAELLTFMRCSHCYTDLDPTEDPGFRKKLDRIAGEGADIVHIGGCANKKETGLCPGMAKMIDMIRAKGIEVVLGTHH